MKKYVFFLLPIILGGCHSHNNSTDAHWDYSGEKSSESWANICAEFSPCAEGHQQSPIDIESYTVTKNSGTKLKFNYHPTEVDVVNNGHSIQANIEESEEFWVDDRNYELKQFHFHEPSEHHLDGIIFPMELHLVHKDEAGNLAVVGLFIKEGKSNSVLEEIWAHIPEHEGEHFRATHKHDLSKLLPENKSMFHYTGSLTTPPCSEGVDWYVMENAIEMSKNQIERFRKLYHNNCRPVQKTERRVVELVK